MARHLDALLLHPLLMSCCYPPCGAAWQSAQGSGGQWMGQWSPASYVVLPLALARQEWGQQRAALVPHLVGDRRAAAHLETRDRATRAIPTPIAKTQHAHHITQSVFSRLTTFAQGALVYKDRPRVPTHGTRGQITAGPRCIKRDLKQRVDSALL